MLASIALQPSACIADEQKTGVSIRTVKVVESINAGGVFYKFEGHTNIEVVMDVSFDKGFVTEPNISGDDLKKFLYKKIRKGAHLICDGREIEPKYGYWPQQVGSTYAKEMTLYYAVPQDRAEHGMSYIYDGSVLGTGARDLRKRIMFSAKSGSKPGDNLITESFEVTPINQGKPKEEALMFNGSSIDIARDKEDIMTLKGKADSFKDKLGRKYIIQDFEYDRIRNKYVVNAKMTLEDGQSTTFIYSKACRGLTDSPKVSHSRTPDDSSGSFTLEQKSNQFIFTTTDGYVNLGVSFDLDDAVAGDMEGEMSFDYVTKGALLRAKSDIRIGECD
jgi:hypothetical protein